MSRSMPTFHAIVSGGGLVGACVALGLADRGHSVAVIEPTQRTQSKQPSHDDRTLVLNAASLNILEKLDLLNDNLVRVPIHQIIINRLGGFGHLALRANDYRQWIEDDTDPQSPYFGQVVVARELGAAMLRRLAEHPNIKEFCPQALTHFEDLAHGVVIELSNGEKIRGDVLVGADGTQSLIRKQLGLVTEHHDYQQSAMVFNAAVSAPQPNTAFERFTPSGPLAILPQSDGRVGVVWIDTHEAIDRLMDLEDADLTSWLEERFGSKLGHFDQPSTRARYPLIKQHSPQTVLGRVALVGNAANTVHPVSAQGFNLGLRDAAGLIDVLAHASRLGNGLTDVSEALLHYQASRLPDQKATCRYTDTLARAFAHPSSLVRLLGGFGLASHAASPTLRRRLVRAAMGFREPVSSLAQRTDHRQSNARTKADHV